MLLTKHFFELVHAFWKLLGGALLCLNMSGNLIVITPELQTRISANFVQSQTKDVKKVKWYSFQFNSLFAVTT